MNLKLFNKINFANFLIIAFIFAIDRATKLYVILLYEKNLNEEIFLSKYLNLFLTWNQGIAFGMLSFNEENLYKYITILILIIILIIYFLLIKSDGFKRYSLLMILGGALGNFFDRVYYKAVPDFIDFHIENFHWFTFNVADIFISLGVFFMIFLEFTDNSTNKKNEFF
jgi:signal peptidase II